MAKKRNDLKSGFSSIIDNIKSSIMNVSSANTTDDIDAALARITTSVVDKDASNYSEMIKTTFSDILQQKFNFKDVSREFIQTYANSDRFLRYGNAEEIVDSIPYCARALKVLTDEIIAPDDINKTILKILNDTNTESYKDHEDNLNQINTTLEIENILHDIVYETLKLGDQFIEICDFTSDDVPISQSILNETTGLFEDLINEEIDMTYTLVEGSEQSWKVKPVVIENASKKDKISIKNVRLIIHDPRYVIKLQSARFKMCLGYIILPRQQLGLSSTDQQIGQLKSLMQGGGGYQDMMGIDKLYSQIMGTVKKYVGDKEFAINKKEVMNMMTRSIKEFDDDKAFEFKVRYVPTERMEHITVSARRFFPYGESIFYKTTFSAKLLIALETATTIKRISDSTETRAFYIETGIPRNARDVIDEVREARTKKKVSIDKMGSVGSIPSMINSYEDYYIPMNNGKKYIEFENVPPAMSVRDVTEELKYFRDILVASLEVPPSFIGLEENTNSKSNLSYESVLFARTIISYQTIMSKHMKSLFNKLHIFIFGEAFNPKLKVTFSPPRMLQLEREAEHIGTIAGMIAALESLGINKEYLKKKYLTGMEWDKIKEFETESNLDKDINPSEEPNPNEFSTVS